MGIEVTEQQGGFIQWIQAKMVESNIYFPFPLPSKGNDTELRIRPNTNKMVRFNTVVPLFKAKKIYLPLDLKQEPLLLEAVNELNLAADRSELGTWLEQPS